MLALGIIAPVFPKLVIQLEGGNEASAAGAVGLFGTVWAAMQFVFAPVLGALSDRVGRRPVILVSCLGLGLDYAVMALAPTVGWLFVGRALSGITASSFSTSFAYIADVTEPDERAGRFGDRKSTRLNSSHLVISYAVFCLKKKKNQTDSMVPSS